MNKINFIAWLFTAIIVTLTFMAILNAIFMVDDVVVYKKVTIALIVLVLIQSWMNVITCNYKMVYDED